MSTDADEKRNISSIYADAPEDWEETEEFERNRIPKPVFGWYEHERNTKRYRRYAVYGEKGLCGTIYLLKTHTPELVDASFVHLRLKGKRKYQHAAPIQRKKTEIADLDADDDADD